MKIYIGVTDGGWFRFLRDRAPLDEVDFWLPSARQGFAALRVGEPFLFKLHSPENYIVGGGFFTGYSRTPVYMAWEAFGERTGARSFTELFTRIQRYRSDVPTGAEFEIGNVLLTAPFFFHEDDWIRAPQDWSLNIVRGKSYDTESGEGHRVWEQVLPLMADTERSRRREGIVERPLVYDGPMYGEPVPVRQRLGQGAFQVMVTDAYGRRCAVTGEKALPTLDAAHILPVSSGGMHRMENGLLLRSDVHRLYDRGYVTVTPDLRFRVSQRLRTDFNNGEPYFPYDGSEIRLPPTAPDRPDRDFLEWHADTVFRS